MKKIQLNEKTDGNKQVVADGGGNSDDDTVDSWENLEEEVGTEYQ